MRVSAILPLGLMREDVAFSSVFLVRKERREIKGNSSAGTWRLEKPPISDDVQVPVAEPTDVCVNDYLVDFRVHRCWSIFLCLGPGLPGDAQISGMASPPVPMALACSRPASTGSPWCWARPESQTCSE